ncbi:MAG: MFS transporter [Candidatus Berkelbacteria bacterium]|nr:MFS transporter [Candidatus Berkelbacteria bacterium]
MPTIRHLISHVKKFGYKHRLLYLLCSMIVFWAIFDGIISYITPLLIVSRGISKTDMGLIIGFSSLAGAFFDFIMCWIFKNATHRRILLLMFAICVIYPLLLWSAYTVSLFVVAMVIWGFYYDLHNISNFEFVGNEMPKDEHSSSFGLIHVAGSFGYLMAPILAGLVVGYFVDWKPLVLAWIFLLISFCFYFAFSMSQRKEKRERLEIRERLKPINLLHELSFWHRIGKLIAPILILTCLINVIDSFFWTIGPLLAESFSKYHSFAGFFMVAFTLPPLLVGWGIGFVTAKFGKKRTAFTAFIIGSLLLATMFLFKDQLILTAIVFVSSFAISFAWPSINGVYADFIAETDSLSREIESMEDFFGNLGYIIGPILAGFFADHFGNTMAFSILGIIVAIVSLILMRYTPKKIKIDKATEAPSHFAIINEIES